MRWLAAAAVIVLLSVELAGADQKTILVLHGTRPDARLSVLGDRELPRMVEQALGARVNHYAEHLDLGRFRDSHYPPAVAHFLGLKYAGQRFDLVIAMHEMVVDFLNTTGKALFPDTPIVFFSDNPNTRRPANSTGVVAEADFASTVTFASTLQPSLKRVYVITGAEVRDKAAESRARRQLSAFQSRFSVTYLSGLSTADLKARISTLPPDAMIYYVLVNRDGAGDRFHPLEFVRDISPLANVPIYSWVDAAIGHGILGGTLKSQEKQTNAVAELAVRVLLGEDPDSIPTTAPDLRVNQVDWREMQRWGISESRLPAGTLVLFKEPTIWERYRGFVLVAITLFLAQAALITGLLLHRARRRQAEARFLKSQSKLQASYDRIRTLGARLLEAQESERARIARELHDDISQQLALLSIELELLRSAVPSEADKLALQARDRTQSIVRSLHDVAHRLYPAKLRLIGLVPALQALQREMERSAIVMNFVHQNVPDSLPPDVTLCVFRVVQEALQNALKYSSAREVSLSLEGTADGLAITIADDGIGFDPSAAWGKGLGLVSMSERLEALNGTFHVHSAPGAGTRLVITVPLVAERRVAAVG